MNNELQKLLDQAKGWKDIGQLLNKEGYPKSEHVQWQDNVKQALRELPDPVDILKKFQRLQRFYNYTWTPDLGNFDTRLELVKKSVTESIDFLEDVLKHEE